jgi:hypothetical protein
MSEGYSQPRPAENEPTIREKRIKDKTRREQTNQGRLRESDTGAY